jgi:hypothetical protein
MDYWIDLFTAITWQQFRDAGASVSGFRPRMKNVVKQVKPGDVLMCYMTGVMRWVGALEVLGPSNDQRDVWGYDFPCRLAVRPLVMLEPEHGIPMTALEGKVDFYQGPEHRSKFKGFVRGSPRRFKKTEDGDLIVGLLKDAEAHPVSRAVDPRDLARKPLFAAKITKGKRSVETLVSVPDRIEPEKASVDHTVGKDTTATLHVEVQAKLANLGAEMGFEVWIARNDRGRTYGGAALGRMPKIVDELPTQFNEATNRTIELIDVLWLSGNSILAAFEVECTTSVYSGLLRMSDLIALQPNLNIRLYIVAPSDRRDKVEQEILRPTFELRSKPLSKTCGFITVEDLISKIEGARSLGLLSSLKPDFVEKIAQQFSLSNT